jgi:hypothetical protein
MKRYSDARAMRADRPRPNVLLLATTRELPPPDQALVSAHLATCESCRLYLARAGLSWRHACRRYRRHVCVRFGAWRAHRCPSSSD